MDPGPTPPTEGRRAARSAHPPDPDARRDRLGWLPGRRVAAAVLLPLATAIAVFAAIPRPTGSPVDTVEVLGQRVEPRTDPAGPPASDAAVPVSAAPVPSPSPSSAGFERPPAPGSTPAPAAVGPPPTAGGTVAPIGTATAIPPPVVVPLTYPDPSPSPAPEPVPCGADDVDFAITTDEKAYAEGEMVGITMTLHNRTSRACDVPERHNGCNSGFVVADAGGRQVWPTGPQPMYPCFLQYSSLEAGATREAHFQWDQNEWACDGRYADSCYRRVARGEYIVRGYWIGGVEATTVFVVS